MKQPNFNSAKVFEGLWYVMNLNIQLSNLIITINPICGRYSHSLITDISTEAQG